jgi:hypothetical protein
MGGLAFVSTYTSDKIALAASRAKVVERDEAPELHDMVERLCAMADLPNPGSPSCPPTCRTFATGRNPKNSVVAVTEGSGTGSASLRSRRARRRLSHQEPRRRDHDRVELLRDESPRC